MQDSKKIFKFNLIPPKTREEIIQIEERDNTILYSFLLIFFSIFVFFILTLVQVAVVNSSKQSAENSLQQYKNQIAELNEIKRLNGELFIKSQALDPLLDKDIKLNQVISIADEILNRFPGRLTITNYERERIGDFSITFILSDSDIVSDIVNFVESKENIENAFIRRLLRSTIDNSSFEFTVSFKITNII